MKLPRRVRIHEVGPRDGLQNEGAEVPTEKKAEFVDRLSAAGLSYIEVTSFVNPKWIPQLADGAELARRIRRRSGCAYAALVPNPKGYEAFRASGLDVAAVFLSASETHNRKNINKTIAETFPVLEEVARAAKKDAKRVLGYVSVVFGCPYEGAVPLDSVLAVVRRLLEIGCDAVSLGDTVGYANPRQVLEVLEEVFRLAPPQRFSMHFHDTRGTALANTLAALEAGAVSFDGSVGGLGGCPYAPGAAGNVATEELVHLFHEMGIETGVDLGKLLDAAAWIQSALGRELPSRYLKAKLSEREK